LINRGELESRFDSYYYNKKFLENEEKLHKIGYIKFHNFINIITKGSTPLMTNEGIPFLKVMNIGEFGFKTKKLDYISLNTHNSMKRSQLHGSEILYSMAGTIGIALNYNKKFGNANINQALAKIILNDITKNQLIVYLLNSNLCKLQARRFLTVSAQPNINFEQIKSIKIPNLSKEQETNIITTMNNAYKIKEQNEQEVKNLFDGIDDYLLDKLGIKLPNEPENNIKNRTFRVSFNDVFNKRLDSIFYNSKKYKLGSGIYKEDDLKLLSSIAKGQSITSSDIKDGIYPVIAGGQTSPYNHNIFNYNGNIITISSSGAYSGYAWYHDYPIFASDCSVVQSKDESIVTTKYLFEILKLKQKELYSFQQGSGQPHVYSRDIKKITIPLPHLNIQNEISKEINKRRTRAKKLNCIATKTLEKAKKRG
jgi:restriction endonuclease S subunit